jgi:ADP-heptose:LPS heptosyltransferase
MKARRRLREQRYDVAADFQGLLKSAALARLSGARRVIGFDREALRERAAAWFYSERVPVSDSQHIIHKNLALAAALGAAADRIEFPIADVHSPTARDLVAKAGRGFAIINPGAAWPNKQWPPERFGAVAKALADRHGLRSIVIWGPGEEDLARAVGLAAGGAVEVAPKTGLHDLIALSRSAKLIVSGDTGPLHIACALGVPAVAVFGPTDADRNGPWAADDLVLSKYRECDCHYERRCRRDKATWCLGAIDVIDVIDVIERRLRRAASDGPQA